VDQSSLILPQLPQLFAVNAGIFSHRPHDAFVAVLDADGDKAFGLQAGDVGLNLAFTDAEEFREITIPRTKLFP
jgi:hypothetical protein